MAMERGPSGGMGETGEGGGGGALECSVRELEEGIVDGRDAGSAEPGVAERLTTIRRRTGVESSTGMVEMAGGESWRRGKLRGRRLESEMRRASGARRGLD